MTRGIRAAATVLALGLAACEGEPAAETGADPDPVAAIADAGETPEPAESPVVRTYPDLTAFDWYRRGEPLSVGGRPYVVEGKPVSASADALRPAGEHEGVEYYVPAGADPPFRAVYVPVFRGYWQAFVAAEAEPALTE